MYPKVEFIIEIWDDHEYSAYKGWSADVLAFETAPEAEARVMRLFQQDSTILGAKIVRVEKSEVKKIVNENASI
jgi:hypothetical protein